MTDREFKLTHGSATLEKALKAASNIEWLVGRVSNGERRALDKLSIEDVALLVQFVRNAATSTTNTTKGEESYQQEQIDSARSEAAQEANVKEYSHG